MACTVVGDRVTLVSPDGERVRVQVEIADDGEAKVLGITRFITDGRGQYLGSFVHGMVAGLAEETRRFLYGDGRDSRRLGKLFQRSALSVRGVCEVRNMRLRSMLAGEIAPNG